jgi:hypothetical protein
MFTSIRRTHATLAASLTAAVVATGMLAPGALAAPNTGATSSGGTVNKQEACDNAYNHFENSVNQAEAADEAGNPIARDQALDDATFYLTAAQMMGCDWAADARVPSFPVVVVHLAPVAATYAAY